MSCSSCVTTIFSYWSSHGRFFFILLFCSIYALRFHFLALYFVPFFHLSWLFVSYQWEPRLLISIEEKQCQNEVWVEVRQQEQIFRNRMKILFIKIEFQNFASLYVPSFDSWYNFFFIKFNSLFLHACILPLLNSTLRMPTCCLPTQRF